VARQQSVRGFPCAGLTSEPVGGLYQTQDNTRRHVITQRKRVAAILEWKQFLRITAIDRFTSNAYDLVIEGESYRPRLKPRLTKDPKERAR
jgi:hypothetical protein